MLSDSESIFLLKNISANKKADNYSNKKFIAKIEVNLIRKNINGIM